MAYLLGQPALTVDGRELPRGHIMIMGGDRVPDGQHARVRGPVQGPVHAVLPAPPPDQPPPTSTPPRQPRLVRRAHCLLRLFAGARADHRRLADQQSRRGFALKLPHSWWLFAVDEAFGAYLTTRSSSTSRKPPRSTAETGSSCGADPGWVKAEANPTAYDTTDFIRKITPTAPRQSSPATPTTTPHRPGPLTCGGGGHLSGTQPA